MTPVRLGALVAKAVNRKPTLLELEAWSDTLACPPASQCPPADCVHDDEADQALRTHVAASTFAPTPADVRRIAIGLANIRVDNELAAQRAAEAARGIPPTPEYLAAAEQLRRKQAERARELEPATPGLSVRDAARAAIDAELTQSVGSQP